MSLRTIRRRLYRISIAEAVIGFLVIAASNENIGDLIGVVFLSAGLALALLVWRLPKTD